MERVSAGEVLEAIATYRPSSNFHTRYWNTSNNSGRYTLLKSHIPWIYHSIARFLLFNFRVFPFVMTYNNKNVGGLFGCNFTFCVPNQHLSFSKFPIFKNIGIYQMRFWVFWRNGFVQYSIYRRVLFLRFSST